MTLRLTIDDQAWRAHVGAMRAATPDLVPVVKGNGYGFGRATLMREASQWADEIAVGTVHELADVAALAGDASLVALTPALHLPPALPSQSVPTVAAQAHVDALRDHGWSGPVAVKLESSMHRHGASPESLPHLLRTLREAHLDVRQFVLHLPLGSADFTPAHAVRQVEEWIGHLDPATPLSLSHLPHDVFAGIRRDHPDRCFRLRTGTGLWHGDKTCLQLTADVLEVRPIEAGQPVGYRQAPAVASGSLVMAGAGSAHGVVPLEGGLSPFHHARQRLALVEPPHMHTSMLFVAHGQPAPSVGEWIDVQRPLISVHADELVWR